MAQPSTPIIDNFNRADGGLSGPPWHGSPGTLGVVSNQLAATPAQGHVFLEQGVSSGQDEWYFTMATWGASNMYLWARHDTYNPSTGSGYRINFASGGNQYIDRVDAGVLATFVGSDVDAPQAGDVYLFQLLDAVLTLWRGRGGVWTSRVTMNDATYTSGVAGLALFDGTTRLDDFGGGDLTAAETVVASPVPRLIGRPGRKPGRFLLSEKRLSPPNTPIFSAASNERDTVLADGPLLYWRLGETSGTVANDQTVNNRDGTLQGFGVGAPTWGVAGALAGDTDTALQLAASPTVQYVSHAYETLLNPQTWSAEAWIWADPAAAGTVRTVISNRDDTGTQKRGFAVQAYSDDTWRVLVGNGTSTWQQLVTSEPVVTAQWIHIVATYDGSTVRLYVNGEMAGQTGVAYQPNQRQEVRVGAGVNESAAAEGWTGSLDEVAMYGTALPIGRITQHLLIGLPSHSLVPMTGMGGAEGLSTVTQGVVPLTVTQNITDGQILTQPVQWIASPSETVPKVEFFIDTVLQWTDLFAPYQYKGDPNGVLDPTIMSPGTHTLAVKATAADGRVANNVITVTVQAAPSPPPATGLPKFGVSTGYKILTRTQANMQFEVDQLALVNAKYLRVDGVAGTPLDNVTSYAAGKGIEMLLAVGSSSSGGLSYPTSDTPAVYANRAVALLTRYPNLRMLETMNEPDKSGWLSAGPQVWMSYVSAMYQAVKVANPNVTVIVGALWKCDNYKNLGTAGHGTLQWISDAYSYGLKANSDMISLHLYDDPDTRDSNWNIWDWAFYTNPSIRSVMNANGDSAKPIISTENGLPTGDTPSGETNQNTVVNHDFDHLVSGQVGMITHYSMMNDDVSGGWGLLRNDLSKRPAWFTCQQRSVGL